jgi:hypothetical protein
VMALTHLTPLKPSFWGGAQAQRKAER